MAGAGTAKHPAWNGLGEGLKFYSDVLAHLRARPPGATAAIAGAGAPADVVNGRTERQLSFANQQLAKASQKSQSRGGAKLTAPLTLVRGGFKASAEFASSLPPSPATAAPGWPQSSPAAASFGGRATPTRAGLPNAASQAGPRLAQKDH